jgi:hypothetical protein
VIKLGDSPAKLLINQGVMITLLAALFLPAWVQHLQEQLQQYQDVLKLIQYGTHEKKFSLARILV